MKIIRKTIVLLYIFSSLYGQQNMPRIVSPEIVGDNHVIFRLQAPEASVVTLRGTMLSDYTGMEMKRNDQGVYELQVGPLEPDIYAYTFNVDGVSALDPNNNVVVRDGSRYENRLMIPGELTKLYDVNEVPHGSVNAVWYLSSSIGVQHRMNVYTPPGYEDSTKSYPVLYLLHGGGGDEEAWISIGRANYIMDNLIALGEAEPMIVVIPNGSVGPQLVTDEMSSITSMLSGYFENSLINDIIPFIEKNYRVETGTEHRALAGLSMGGLHVMNIFMAEPEMFGYINVMSSGWFIDNEEMYVNGDKRLSEIAPVLNQNVRYLLFTQGGPEDIAYNNGIEMLKVFEKNKISFEFSEREGGHSWSVWRKDLVDFAPKLFK